MLYTLQHIGYTIPPQADAGCIGEAGPGPSYLDPGSGGSDNDLTNRNTAFMTWNLMHLARLLTDAGGIPAYGNQRSQWTPAVGSSTRTPSTAAGRPGSGLPHGLSHSGTSGRPPLCLASGAGRPRCASS